MSTTEYLDTLDINQLRFARDEAARRIKAAEDRPKKIVWVVSNGIYNVSWHRQDDYLEALQSLLRVINSDDGKEPFTDMLEHKMNAYHFADRFPKITPYVENETEYEEWFK